MLNIALCDRPAVPLLAVQLYGAMPLETLTVIEPLAAPHDVVGFPMANEEQQLPCRIVKHAVLVHPLASVTVTQ